MAIKLDFISNANTKLVWCAILLFMLGAVFFVKKKQAVEEAKLNNQIINLSINSDENRPVVAIVIGAIGSLKLDDLVDISHDITIGIPSYIDLEDNDKLLDHNIALNIPVEFNSYFDDSKELKTIHTKDSEQEKADKLYETLNKKFNYQAIYTVYDESYANSYSKAEYFLKLLQSKNIIYLAGLKDKDNVFYKAADKLNYLILKNDIILDEEISSEYIMKKLLELENIAKQTGFAIAIGNAYPLTIKLIKEWVSTLPDKDIKLVSIKDFYKIYSNKQLSVRKDN